MEFPLGGEKWRFPSMGTLVGDMPPYGVGGMGVIRKLKKKTVKLVDLTHLILVTPGEA